ncbi:MAG: hypothetical protein MSH49_08445 [[Eubacterium] saphenum]|nr:hypothetical protein [[Eubacterium] saphenum]
MDSGWRQVRITAAVSILGSPKIIGSGGITEWSIAENCVGARFRGCEQARLAMSESRDGSTRTRGRRCRVERQQSSGLLSGTARVSGEYSRECCRQNGYQRHFALIYN